jgi:hypothetical protein
MATREQHGKLSIRLASPLGALRQAHLHLVDFQVRRAWSTQALLIEKGDVLLGCQRLSSGGTGQVSIDVVVDRGFDIPALGKRGEHRLGRRSAQSRGCISSSA